jgi:hypothetical protein
MAAGRAGEKAVLSMAHRAQEKVSEDDDRQSWGLGN